MEIVSQVSGATLQKEQNRRMFSFYFMKKNKNIQWYCFVKQPKREWANTSAYGTVEIIDMNFLQITRFENSFHKDKRFSGIQHFNITF